MYLISVEGGDGSGKGEAVRLLNEILAKYPFADVCSTHEPRRHADAGRRALEAVQRGDMTPAEEAALFAEDRLDHTKSWILPRLQRSAVVISDRNIHSSLVYQGVVGDLGLDEVATLNEGAAVPDLVVWIDCDPERAIRRIQSGTLRMTSAKQEYFETSDIQKKIRAGFASLLSGEVQAPAPFDRCTIAGPVLNEGGLDELEKMIADVDVVCETLLNWQLKLGLSDRCMRLGVPLIHSGIVGHRYQCYSIMPGKSACLRCALPKAGIEDFPLGPTSVHPLIAVEAWAGSVMAIDVLKIVADLGVLQTNTLWRLDPLSGDREAVRNLTQAFFLLARQGTNCH